ncbi:hypothetical protein COX05_03685 [candidate division WWE3 bacterium CG22_combo_CG10-13_8_21_14_all_39_12]|uniref:Type II secretion system protein GspG C-terminal domain-containing protein n=2 Tax=Katanobacteria TaxID=422282 RepID=A0A2M7X118_UNCKA|nr:MAG: hypothetical protein COX05_03685 [candidate division WWE3 bacterium CG22_combo_CG10-13_8_21_14_all_39_12]PJA39870.1 MAG: hypothetical protein CO179_04155 [candidate division WWE3 bacterium CG_4_9_14_3_um_filter_39_7]
MATNLEKNNPAFTLIELLVVIVIIGLLAGIGIASFQGSLQRGRDSVRMSTIKEVKDAVERYWVDNGNYPGTTTSYGEDNSGAGMCGGWDSSWQDKDGDGIAWVDPLVEDGYLESIPQDVSFDSGKTAGCGNYDYFRYTAGSYGCDATRGDYFVVGIRDLEASSRPANGSPGWTCPGNGPTPARDWQTEFDWVTGKFQR